MRAVNDFDDDTPKKRRSQLREVKIVRSDTTESDATEDASIENGESTVQAEPTPGSSPGKIAAVVVDDEPANQDFLVRLLRQAKLHVEGAGTGKEALDIVERLGADIALVMLDRKLPDMTGVEVLSVMRPKLPDAKIMMATMFDERWMIREAFNKGANAFLVKPHGFMDLFQLVNGCVQNQTGFDCLEGLIFDQYGRRQWRGH
jgi:CheY-like chemotaxis protein